MGCNAKSRQIAPSFPTITVLRRVSSSLNSRYRQGGIIIEDDVWLGFGVIVLMEYELARAVVGAGSVVTHDIRTELLLRGYLRVKKMRSDLATEEKERAQS
jgi:acetyltransferase-like isoleucine patch superfamily enzyme